MKSGILAAAAAISLVGVTSASAQVYIADPYVADSYAYVAPPAYAVPAAPLAVVPVAPPAYAAAPAYVAPAPRAYVAPAPVITPRERVVRRVIVERVRPAYQRYGYDYDDR